MIDERIFLTSTTNNMNEISEEDSKGYYYNFNKINKFNKIKMNFFFRKCN